VITGDGVLGDWVEALGWANTGAPASINAAGAAQPPSANDTAARPIIKNWRPLVLEKDIHRSFVIHLRYDWI
jgi:hypothetical protein